MNDNDEFEEKLNEMNDKISKMSKLMLRKLAKLLSKKLMIIAVFLFKYVVLPILILYLIIFSLATVYDLWNESKGNRKEYQTVSPEYANTVELTNTEDSNDGYEVVSVSAANRLIQSYYTYIGQDSYYVMVGDDKKLYTKTEAEEKFGEVETTTFSRMASRAILRTAVSGDSIAKTAHEYIGYPYVWGGTTPAGFDCSGFVQYVYKQHGVDLPRMALDQISAGTQISFSERQNGDIVYRISPYEHVGIVVDNGASVIDAANELLGVRKTDFKESEWLKIARISGIDPGDGYVDPGDPVDPGDDDDITNSTFRDKYGREKYFYLSPDFLYTLDTNLHGGEFVYPEQFLKPVYADLEEFKLLDIINEDGEFVAESTKYKLINDGEYSYYKKTSDKTKGLWDYGFSPILHYEEYEEKRDGVGKLTKDQKWDKDLQEFVDVEVTNGKEIVESFPGYPKKVWLIDKVITHAGAVTNKILYEYVDTGIPWKKTESYDVEVEIYELEEVHQSDEGGLLYYQNVFTSEDVWDIVGTEKRTVVGDKGMMQEVTFNIYGYKSYAKADSNLSPTEKKVCSEAYVIIGEIWNGSKLIPQMGYVEKCYTYDETDNIGNTVTDRPVLKEEMVFKRMETRTAVRTYEGTIHEQIPKYDGQPDTSNLSGDKYTKDYLGNYKVMIPENAMPSLDIAKRMRMTDNELIVKLEELERADIEKYYSESPDDKENKNPYDGGVIVITPGEDGKYKMEDFLNYDVRQSSNLTAEALERYLLEVLKDKPDSAYLKTGGGSEKTIASDIILAAAELQIDPVFIVAQSAHESAWATSTISKLKNNFYGIAAFDRCPLDCAYSWDTPLEGILGGASWVKENFVDKGQYTPYLLKHPPTGRYAYASDPTYDQKIAQIMATIYNGTGATPGGAYNFTGVSKSKKTSTAWMKSIWKTIKKNIPIIFDDMPDKYSDKYVQYSEIIPEENAVQILRMSLAMQEERALSTYDDFDNEEYKKKIALLFTNPLGTGWGNDSNDDEKSKNLAEEYFPGGYELPLKTGEINILNNYGEDSEGNIHNGVDISAAMGIDVFAVYSGKVKDVGENDKLGKYVVITHSSKVEVTYGNLNSVDVTKGNSISKGQKIGTTGRSSKDENFIGLHFEMKVYGITSDPTWIFTRLSHGNFTFYSQHDPEWAYVRITPDGQNISDAGCGPTSMAIALSGYNLSLPKSIDTNGDGKLTPNETATWGYNNGYIQNYGSDHELFYRIANLVGVKARAVSHTEAIEEVKKGKPIILSLSGGVYGYSGHLLTWVGYESGKVFVMDPNMHSLNGEKPGAYNKNGLQDPALFLGAAAFYVIE